MKTLIAITDLTRMNSGRVCIAGYDKERNCIRPVLPPPGIGEQSIIVAGRAIAYPFAVIECDLLQHTPNPPHTEDHEFDPASLRFVRRVEASKKQTVLQWSLRQTVTEIFEQPIQHDAGHYVLEGHGPRSLGTIRPHAIARVEYKEGIEGTWSYRILFKDAKDWYNLKITDLTWHYYCDTLRSKGSEPDQIATELTALLKHQTVYLRIGLSRGWKKFPGRCFLQINAIHTVPDYLQGK